MAVFFFLGMIFFGMSKFIFDEEVPVNQTPLKEEFDLRSNGKMQINKWVYDEKNQKMELILVTNGMKDYKTELNFSAITRENMKKELPVDVVFSDNEVYVIQISNVKKGFNQIALRLHKKELEIEESFDEENIKEDKNKGIFSTIYTDERVVKKESISKKDKNDYVLEVTNNMIDDTLKQKEELEGGIEKINKAIEGAEEEIEVQEEELLYQTTEEQVKTMNKISRLENDISNYNKEISEINVDINSMNTKIERLEQKKRDIEIN